MKKKLTAVVALMALLMTMLPTAVFAASDYDIDISVINFNSNMTEQNNSIIVYLSGSDVDSGDRVVCYLENEDKELYNGVIQGNGSETIWINKSDVPNIEDPFADNEITVTVMSANSSQVYKSEHFYQEVVSTTPEKMIASVLDNKEGTKDRDFIIKFDENYMPGDNDVVRLQGLDADGDEVGGTNNTTITQGKLNSDVDADGMRALKNKITASFDSKVETVRVSFVHNGTVMKDLTQEVSLKPPYGEFKKLELVFDNNGYVAQGDTIKGTLYYINTEGERHDVTDRAVYNYDDSPAIASSSQYEPALTVKDNAAVGTKIKVTAYYDNDYTKMTQATVTVSEKTTPGEMSMLRTSGKAGVNISQTFSLRDENGDAKVLNFQPSKVSAEWINASDETANVTVTSASLGNLDYNGTMTAVIKSDRPTSGNFVLTFTDNAGHSYQATSPTFTFTDPNATPETTTVIMNIGSTDMLVNDETLKIDAAPVIYQDRTFVPLRSLAQAFGAEVKWEGSDSSITVTLDDTVVVMTAGSLNYTVNGVVKTTDAAPYIVAGANRTMVPVRVISEALGFKVTALQRPDHTTYGVMFEG